MDLLNKTADYQFLSTCQMPPFICKWGKNSWRQLQQFKEIHQQAFKYIEAVWRFCREKIVFFMLEAKTAFDWVISFPQGMTTSKSIAVHCRQFKWVTGASSRQVDENESFNQGRSSTLQNNVHPVCYCHYYPKTSATDMTLAKDYTMNTVSQWEASTETTWVMTTLVTEANLFNLTKGRTKKHLQTDRQTDRIQTALSLFLNAPLSLHLRLKVLTSVHSHFVNPDMLG